MSSHVSVFWLDAAQIAAWGIAVTWCWRTANILRTFPRVPDLNDAAWDRTPEGEPSLTVVVPAKDEAENIAATLDSLLAADWPSLRIIAVDDRSTDDTGKILNEYARRHPFKLDVLHVTELPEGWLGKTFALVTATDASRSDYLLFTDADVTFSPSILRRALVYAVASQADHLVVLPTMLVRSYGEGVLLGFFQVFGMWAVRLWRIADPDSEHDVVGVGAFNLVRRDALAAMGGWAPQRLAILEDITLGRRMKAEKRRQRLAFAPGAVEVHWARGVRGLMGVMTKNLFSAFNFRPVLVFCACLWTAVFYFGPLAELGWRSTAIPGLIVLVCLGLLYRTIGKISRIEARYVWLYPLGAIAFLGAMLRSMADVLWRGGVVWRGTFYPLKELRQHNSPFQWKR